VHAGCGLLRICDDEELKEPGVVVNRSSQQHQQQQQQQQHSLPLQRQQHRRLDQHHTRLDALLSAQPVQGICEQLTHVGEFEDDMLAGAPFGDDWVSQYVGTGAHEQHQLQQGHEQGQGQGQDSNHLGLPITAACRRSAWKPQRNGASSQHKVTAADVQDIRKRLLKTVQAARGHKQEEWLEDLPSVPRTQHPPRPPPRS